MIKTLSLLEDKNSYLEKFIALNTIKLTKLSKSEFEDLEEFRESRENILNIIKHIDTLIEARTLELDPQSIPQSIKEKIAELLTEKDELVHTILSQDLEIMQIIDVAKSQIILELQSVRKVKKSIGSYKSFNKEEDSYDEEA